MNRGNRIETVAVVGAGVVGRGWLPVFIGGGCETRVYDIDPAHSRAAIAWCHAFIRRRVELNEMSEDTADLRLKKLRLCNTLEEAVAGAHYVQESIPENLSLKRELFSRLDALTHPSVVLASSTSSMDIESIAAGLGNPGRCVTVHPFNPAAILPAVEIFAIPMAPEGFLDRVDDFLRELGQKPVRMNRFILGYIGNRLQLALMREAFHLVESGIATTEAIDDVLSQGLALRWALLGTFGTNHTNADEGIRSYYQTFGPTLTALMDDLSGSSPTINLEMIDRFGCELETRFEDIEVSDLSKWRDDMVGRIQHLKRSQPIPSKSVSSDSQFVPTTCNR